MAFPTEQEVYHRLRWDPRFAVARCAIVYTLRPEGTKKVPLTAWDRAVPWHRIVEFWIGDELAWSRPQRIDRLDALAGEAGDALGEPLAGRPCSAPPTRGCLRVATWNVLFDRYTGEDGTPRWRELLDRLARVDPDVVVLVEVTPKVLDVVLAHAAFATYAVSHDEVAPYGQVVLARFPMRAHALALSRDKRVTFATLDVGGSSLGVAAVHLTSDRKLDAPAIRVEQLATVMAAIARAPRELGWLVAGDFNGASLEATDAWIHDTPGLTFDPANNPLAAAQSRSGRGARLDRIYALGPLPVACTLIGQDAPPSDHYGVVADVATGVGRLALAVVPPVELWGPIQRVRCANDDKFAKWPPHLTIELPFEGSVPSIAPFDVALERTIALGRVHALAPADPAPFRALGVQTPHLTIGRASHSLSARWRVERLVVLAEHGGRFTPLDELAARTPPHPVVARLRETGVNVVPFGSAVYAPSCAGDVDAAVDDPARVVAAFGLRPAGANHWRGTIDGTPVDVVASDEGGAADAHALRDHLVHHGRYDAFVAALPRVRAFAHARGLLHDALGYLGTFGWALLLADPVAHDAELCAVPAERAFEAWLAYLPRASLELRAPASGRDVARNLTASTRATLLAEFAAPTLVDLADAPPPGDTIAIPVPDRGAYLSRARTLVAALEAAGCAPRVWGRFDGDTHRITVRDRALAASVLEQ